MCTSKSKREEGNGVEKSNILARCHVCQTKSTYETFQLDPVNQAASCPVSREGSRLVLSS